MAIRLNQQSDKIEFAGHFVGRGHDPAEQVGHTPYVRPTIIVWMSTYRTPFIVG